MLRYLRMDLYRLVKGKMLWVMMGIVLAMSVMMAFMMWLTTTPEFAQSVTGSASIHIGISDGSSEPVDIQDIQGLSDSVIADFTQNQSTMWLGGGAMAVFVAMMVALFFALDFTTGYVKNLPSARRDRLAYYGEKLVFVVLLSAALFAFGIATFELARMAAGFSYGHVGTFGEVAAWFGSAVVVLSAYGAVTAVVARLTQNKTAAIATALVVGSGVVGQVLAMIFGSLSSLWEPFARVAEWLPFSSYALLQQGGEALLASSGDIGHILISCGAVLVACVAVALGVCARKDV